MESNKLKDRLTFKEILDSKLNDTELDNLERICKTIGNSFAVTGMLSYEKLYNKRDLQEIGSKIKVPYDKLIQCIYDNQMEFKNKLNECV